MPQGWWKSVLLLLTLTPLAALSSPENPEPELPDRSLLLKNTAYSASYNAAYKQSDWIFYALGKNELQSCAKRSNSFRVDPRVPSEQAAQLADYKGSGFDRGHLTPAGDNRWSAAAMSESFLLSNVSPQPSRFNGGIWAKLEGLVRAWAKNMGGLWVTTGPLLENALPTIGDGRVAVPKQFYKVLATMENGDFRAVAFLLPTDASGDLGKYAMTVNQLENITGLDFLVEMEREEESESKIDLERWDLKARFEYFPCTAIAPGVFEWAWGLSGFSERSTFL